ncbi:flagellar motor switch protein FliM [Halanaerobaculum tunisiense]
MSSDRVLSQDEIDSLLDAMSSGEVEADDLKEEEEQQVEVYDFKHPNKLSKDQLRTLRMIYEGFGRLVSTAISTKLRTMGKIEVASIEQLSYDEFIRSLPQPTVMATCDFNPFHGEFIIEMNPKVAFSIVERTFGGGVSSSENEVREFTDIEEVVLKKITKMFLENFAEAWENVADLRPRLKELESNPQFTQIVPGNDMVILATFNTYIGDTGGLINICIPYIVLEPIVSKLSAQYWFSATRDEIDEEGKQKLKQGLGRAKLPIEVELGKTNIKVGELLKLQEGDVLRLDTKSDDDLTISIDQRAKFKGEPGKLDNKLAVEIISAISEEEWEGESNE